MGITFKVFKDLVDTKYNQKLTSDLRTVLQLMRKTMPYIETCNFEWNPCEIENNYFSLKLNDAVDLTENVAVINLL